MATAPLPPLTFEPTRTRQLVPDSYLTDGRRLLRVVEASAERAFASLEDCLTLEVRAYSPGELLKLRLRPVTPG